MSRKRTKQYLMLLMVIGLVSIAAGGSGTFASFSAQTTNAGNYFATGSLILNDNGGHSTCTSAVATGTVNSQNTNAGTDCDVLFKMDHFVFASSAFVAGSGTVNSGTSGAVTVAAITGTGTAIYPGDTLLLSNASGTQTDTVVASAYSGVGATSITADWSTISGSNSYATGDTITDENATYLDDLTLQNAGTINASGISFDASNACTSAYKEPSTTLSSGVTINNGSTNVLTVADYSNSNSKSYAAGEPVVVSHLGHAQTFIATGSGDTATTIHVQPETWNYSYPSGSVVSGPEFHGGSAQSLCDDLAFSITETDSNFSPDFANAAGCAYGDHTTPVNTNACDLTNSAALTSLPTTMQPLTLASGAGSGNAAGGLDAGGSRYFLLAVHYTGPTFDNTWQNTATSAFDLTWRIDQA